MDSATRNRLIWIGIVVAALAAAVGARLVQLQVRDSGRLRARALNQHERRITEPAVRGAILDREGRELAVSLETESLYAHPSRIDSPEVVARLLASVLPSTEAQLRDKLSSGERFTYLQRFLDPDTAQRVRELDLPLADPNAVGFLREFKRHYPRGTLAAHVVGFANIDGKGLAGAEQAFDEVLSGDPTVYLVRQDARSGRIRQPIQRPARHARDVVLTLDLVLQHIVERELERAVAETGARAASAILLDPVSGHVLALANRPTADPNRYGSAGREARANRALEHYYEPGSTFKVVPLATALEERTVRPDQRFFCERGALVLEGRVIRDISPHGRLALNEILAQSSNIGMVKVTRTLEPATLRESLQRFGFGATTGIELPAESAGRMRLETEWSEFSQDSLAFGQEIAVTVVQMGAALAALANDGVWVGPRVVLGVRDAEGRLQPAPPSPRRRVVSQATAREVRRMMEGVIAGGTGGRAAVPGYRMAGKSGTAQKAVAGGYSDSEYMASFGGFGPSDGPRLTALVVLDTPRGEWIYGGQVAAPVFARIMGEALRHLRVPYDQDPRPVEAVQARRQPAPGVLPPAQGAVDDGRVPDVRGLGSRQAVALLGAHGCGAVVEGQGVVQVQSPAAGDALPEDGVCRVVLAPPERLLRDARSGRGAGS